MRSDALKYSLDFSIEYQYNKVVKKYSKVHFIIRFKTILDHKGFYMDDKILKHLLENKNLKEHIIQICITHLKNNIGKIKHEVKNLTENFSEGSYIDLKSISTGFNVVIETDYAKGHEEIIEKLNLMK